MLQAVLRCVLVAARRAPRHSRRITLFRPAASVDREASSGIFRAPPPTGHRGASRNSRRRFLRTDPDLHSGSGSTGTAQTAWRLRRAAFWQASNGCVAGRTRLGTSTAFDSRDRPGCLHAGRRSSVSGGRLRARRALWTVYRRGLRQVGVVVPRPEGLALPHSVSQGRGMHWVPKGRGAMAPEWSGHFCRRHGKIRRLARYFYALLRRRLARAVLRGSRAELILA